MVKVMNEKELKAVFFEGLFTNQVVKYKHSKDGKYVDFTLVCTNESLQNFFNKQYNKYKSKKPSYTDFISECMYWTNVAVQRFQVRDSGDWEGILDGTDKANIGRLVTSIKTTVENELIRYINDDVKYSKKTIDGEKQHVKYKFNMTSLDSLMVGADGEETALIEMISEEMGYWSPKMNSKADHFKEWFTENAKRVLTKSQYNLLKSLEKCSHQQDGYTENDMYEVTGVSSKNLSTALKRIRERVLKAYQKENPMGKKTQLEMYRDREVKLWNKLMDIVYADDIELQDQNKAISNWLLNNLDNEKVSNIVYDLASPKESIAVTNAYRNGGEIPSKVLYKVIEKVEQRLDYLQQMDVKSVPFYKKESEMGRWTPQAHKEYAEYLKGFMQSPCYVYDKEGNLLREEAWKPFKKKDAHIYEVLPTGIIQKINKD